MSRSGRVELFFGDGKRFFALTIEGMEAVQEACDAGPEYLIAQLQAGTYRLAAVRETLRWGMIGAGDTATDAAIALEKWAGPGALAQWKAQAVTILAAFLYGAPDEDDALGEDPPPGDKRPSRAARSGSGRSTRSAAAPSAGRRAKSRRPASGG